MNEKPSSNTLKDVQIIVRYCFFEEPYWNAFISHYFNLGVRKIYIIHQFEEDKISLKKFSYPKDLDIFIYKSEERDPNSALINFRIDQIKKKEKYTLLVDPDEFLYSFNKNFNLSDMFANKKRLYLRWLMNPITKNKSLSSGFMGPAGKEIACSESIKGIFNCHRFKPTPKILDDVSRFGLFLIHNWSRSLIDCLLKTTFSKFKTEKSYDQGQIQKNLKKGILFSRAKYLAFLDIQNRYITGINDSYTNHFDQEKELELILTKYSKFELKLFFELFEEYKIKLSNSVNLSEVYPPLTPIDSIDKQMKRIRLYENK